MSIACSFVWLVFLFRTKRKRKLPWMIAPGYLVLHVLHVLHVFLMFPFLFQELKELGKEVDKLKKVCLFFECLWSRNKNFLLEIVCCQEKENISTLNAEYVKVCFWTCFLCKKKYFFSCVYCHSRSLKVSTSWRLFLVYRNWISYFTCIYIFFVYLRRRIAWKLNTKIWPRTVCLHVFFSFKINISCVFRTLSWQRTSTTTSLRFCLAICIFHGSFVIAICCRTMRLWRANCKRCLFILNVRFHVDFHCIYL